MTEKRYKELVQASRYPHGLGYLGAAAIDPEIETIVHILRSQGVETCQSCQGGRGHSYAEPIVEFVGDEAAGWFALSVAFNFHLPVSELRRSWCVRRLSVDRPLWQLTFDSSKMAEFNARWKREK